MTTKALLSFAAAAAVFVPPLLAAEPTELELLRAQVAALEKRISELERRQEPAASGANAASGATRTPAAPPAGKVTVNDRGVTLASADGANAVKVRGLVQADARHYFDAGAAPVDAFVLRRARLITEGVFARRFGFQLVSEFGGTGSPSILDANVSVTWSEALQLKAGKFKAPVGLEQLQSDSWTFFNERSIVTNLVPNRDVGFQAAGEIAAGRISYAAGVFNGVADGASSTNTDFDDHKDLAGRIWLEPFRGDQEAALRGLGVGLGGSVGRQEGGAGRTSGYRSDGQQAFFSYLPGAVADGRTWRVSPQFDFRRGSFGLLGEYVWSTANVRATAIAPLVEVRNRAWQVAAGYVLTGEDSSPGGVAPRADFNPAEGSWGAFELTARIAGLEVDEDAFPAVASSAASAAEATSLGLGLNWYLGKAAALKVGYYHTEFDPARGAPATTAFPEDEKVLITRLQLGF